MSPFPHGDNDLTRAAYLRGVAVASGKRGGDDAPLLGFLTGAHSTIVCRSYKADDGNRRYPSFSKETSDNHANGQYS